MSVSLDESNPIVQVWLDFSCSPENKEKKKGVKYLLLVLSISGDDRAWENKSQSWWAKVEGEKK